MVINIMNALRARGIGVGSKLEGTALAGDVRKDETFMNADGGPVTGTLVTRDGGGPVAVTPGTATQTLQAGIYDNNISIAGDADLTPENLRDTANVFGVIGNYDHSAVPITAANVIAGKEGFVNGVKVTGTMVDRGAVTITPGTIDQAIAAGYHNGAGKVLGDADLAAGNVRDLVNIFGVIGNYDHSAVPITAANVIAGKEGFVNGVKVTGTMVDKVGSGTVITPSTVDQVIPAGRYGGAAGDGKVLGDADLAGPNIVLGKRIFDVDGTYDKVYGVGDSLGTGNCTVVQVANTSAWELGTTISIINRIDTDGTYVYAAGGDAVRKYDAAGNQIWTKTFALAYGICTPGDGYIYITRNETSSSSIDVYILDSTGTATRWNNAAAVCPTDIDVDLSGNVYVLYSYASGYAMQSWNSAGTLRWRAPLNPYNARDVAVDTSGNSFIVYYNASGKTLIKLDTAGVEVWSKTDDTYLRAVHVDKDNNVFTIGNSGNLRKYANDGTLIWTKPGMGGGPGLTTNAQGDIFVGSTTVRRLDSSGNEIWNFTTQTNGMVSLVADNTYLWQGDDYSNTGVRLRKRILDTIVNITA